jgi:hypothetical protein
MTIGLQTMSSNLRLGLSVRVVVLLLGDMELSRLHEKVAGVDHCGAMVRAWPPGATK